MKPKVLIIEDDFAVKRLWRETISADCQVVYAQETSDAYAAMSDDELPDILVLDWHLNGDGRAILNTWLEQLGGPSCIISANLTKDEIIEFYSRGVLHVLEKPISTEVFKAVLQHYFNLVEMKRSSEQMLADFDRMHKRQRIMIVLLFVIVLGKEFMPMLMSAI